MKFQLSLSAPSPAVQIEHHHQILLSGSCFTEHMTGFMRRGKMNVMQNSHGIMFNPLALSNALHDLIQCKSYALSDLFLLNEYWNSWYHHSDFSFRDPQKSVDAINQAIASQHSFLKEANHVILTLGSAFAYYHLEEHIYVSNNHRAPSDWFRKDLLPIEKIQQELSSLCTALQQFNPKLQIIFTVSPVRHIRDGVIENNRSKARLIEAVHSISNSYYFPAYEFVIDILRDYRFYDIDMVHPNYQATQFIWQQFMQTCMSPDALPILEEFEKIFKAAHHKAKDTESLAHQKFKSDFLGLCQQMKLKYPYVDLSSELSLFSS
jgi:hypothetical protein